MHIVSAWCQANGITLGQIAVDEKSNEITAIPKLLDMLVLKGCIITIDAMGCQKEIAAKIISEAANYVFGLKGNQVFFAQKLLECTKAHWEVENKLHWMLDVIFREDASRIRTDDAPHNLSAIRKLAYYHLKQETSQKSGVKMKQKKAALSTEYLEKVLATTLSRNWDIRGFALLCLCINLCICSGQKWSGV